MSKFATSIALAAGIVCFIPTASSSHAASINLPVELLKQSDDSNLHQLVSKKKEKSSSTKKKPSNGTSGQSGATAKQTKTCPKDGGPGPCLYESAFVSNCNLLGGGVSQEPHGGLTCSL